MVQKKREQKILCSSRVMPLNNPKLFAIDVERDLDANKSFQYIGKLVYEAVGEKEIYLSTSNTLEDGKQIERDQKSEKKSILENFSNQKVKRFRGVIKSGFN